MGPLTRGRDHQACNLTDPSLLVRIHVLYIYVYPCNVYMHMYSPDDFRCSGHFLPTVSVLINVKWRKFSRNNGKGGRPVVCMAADDLDATSTAENFFADFIISFFIT